jgi:succinate dehydrogenase / fumarate reductase iron-sulfur subunit
MSYLAKLRVWRGDAGSGELKDYKVEVNEGEVVLDVLHRLQATQARPGGALELQGRQVRLLLMEINGMPRLMCMTRMSTFTEEETLTVTPMRTFPVIRDLVTDVSFNYAKAREIPSFTPDPPSSRASSGCSRRTSSGRRSSASASSASCARTPATRSATTRTTRRRSPARGS